jgi:hypothetical protein
MLDVLFQERRALKALDQAAIEAATNDKLALDAEIRRVARSHGLRPHHRARLEQLRLEADHNRLLLSHARSCVQGVIAALTGGALDGAARPGTPKPLKLSIRG